MSPTESTQFYRHPMPMPSSPGTPLFDGADVTEFLARFEDMCDEYQIDAPSRAQKLPRYCTVVVGRYVSTMTASQAKDWEVLKEDLKKDFKHKDTVQLLYTR